MDKWILQAIAAINIITFIIYGWDKICARKNRRRIPESTLLWLAFLCGSLGALLGMEIFRHKTKHRKFMILVPLFLGIHICLAVWLLLF